MKTVLTIAGFDPSGGAGILADIKTISRFDCYGVAAVTSLTIQNTQGVWGLHHQTPEFVSAQLDVLFDDFEIGAIKIGMLPEPLIELVAKRIASASVQHVVVDPVITSSSGFDLVDREAHDRLKASLLPLASVVTPNAAEAAVLAGIPISTREQMQEAAAAIRDMVGRPVLVTGGDVEGEFATDVLADDGVVWYSTDRVSSTSTHGTGCTLSSALACLLVKGHSLREAIHLARTYVAEAIAAAPGLGKGHGPLNHFPPRK